MPLNAARWLATFCLAAALFLVLAVPQGKAAQAVPPHAWLFGAWAGGIDPAPSNMSAAECQARATFVVTQDAVVHSTLTHPGAIENLIASVRGTPGGTIFLLAPSQSKPQTVAGITEDLGFGCPQPDVLRVVKVGTDEIRFPDCTGFPSPLVRCSPPGR